MGMVFLLAFTTVYRIFSKILGIIHLKILCPIHVRNFSPFWVKVSHCIWLLSQLTGWIFRNFYSFLCLFCTKMDPKQLYLPLFNDFLMKFVELKNKCKFRFKSPKYPCVTWAISCKFRKSKLYINLLRIGAGDSKQTYIHTHTTSKFIY